MAKWMPPAHFYDFWALFRIASADFSHLTAGDKSMRLNLNLHSSAAFGFRQM